eukprot:7815748-Pyramimonas_sp.AAC.1
MGNTLKNAVAELHMPFGPLQEKADDEWYMDVGPPGGRQHERPLTARRSESDACSKAPHSTKPHPPIPAETLRAPPANWSA